jgi:hypothetical protein
MCDVDDGVRGTVGILISVVDVGQSGVRLVFDRVKRDGKCWIRTEFATSKDMDKSTLLEMTMPEEDLNSIGLVLAAELSALKGRGG